MKPRAAKLLLLIALSIPLTGCPSSNIQPGLWLFYKDGTISDIGLRLLSNGETETPPIGPSGVNGIFSGTLTWSQTGNDVTVTQFVGDNVNVHIGEAIGRTAISGTWVRTEGAGAGDNAGFWSAIRVAD